MQLAFVALAFVAGFLLVFGLNLTFFDILQANQQKARKRLEQELRSRRLDRVRDSLAAKEAYELAAQGAVDLTPSRSLGDRFANLVEESGLAVRPALLAGYCLVLALVAALATWLLLGRADVTVLATGLAGVVPFLYVLRARAKRQEKLLSQLPDAFDLMSRTMRAGQTISQAFQAVADDFSSPIADEFGYAYDQQNLGLSPEAAMRDLARRTGLLELKIFVLAVMVHRQTGGNLSELLDKLSAVIRDRYRIRGAIKALTAEGRFQAIILLALPPLLMGALFFLNRPYIMTLFQFPWLALAMFAAMLVGGLWMRSIVRFDF